MIKTNLFTVLNSEAPSHRVEVADELFFLAESIHLANAAKGFWSVRDNGLVRELPECLALIHSEVSEAYAASVTGIMDCHLPEHPGVHVEWIDALIRTLDSAFAFSPDSIRLAAYDVCFSSLLSGLQSQEEKTFLRVHCQISEVLETYRSGQRDSAFDLTFSALITELVIVCASFSAATQILEEKLEVNRKRPHKHGRRL